MSPVFTHVTTETRRRKHTNKQQINTVTSARLPSGRPCCSMATAGGHRLWDSAFPHGSRKQQTHYSVCTGSAHTQPRTMRLRAFVHHQNLDLTVQRRGNHVPAANKTPLDLATRESAPPSAVPSPRPGVSQCRDALESVLTHTLLLRSVKS